MLVGKRNRGSGGSSVVGGWVDSCYYGLSCRHICSQDSSLVAVAKVVALNSS